MRDREKLSLERQFFSKVADLVEKQVQPTAGDDAILKLRHAVATKEVAPDEGLRLLVEIAYTNGYAKGEAMGLANGPKPLL